MKANQFDLQIKLTKKFIGEKHEFSFEVYLDDDLTEERLQVIAMKIINFLIDKCKLDELEKSKMVERNNAG